MREVLILIDRSLTAIEYEKTGILLQWETVRDTMSQYWQHQLKTDFINMVKLTFTMKKKTWYIEVCLK